MIDLIKGFFSTKKSFESVDPHVVDTTPIAKKKVGRPVGAKTSNKQGDSLAIAVKIIKSEFANKEILRTTPLRQKLDKAGIKGHGTITKAMKIAKVKTFAIGLGRGKGFDHITVKEFKVK